MTFKATINTCSKGHAWTKENHYWWKNEFGKIVRRCAACRKDYRKQYYWRKKVEPE